MERGKRHEMSGWGRYPVQECVHYRPEKRRVVDEILRLGPETSYLARGLGRSYGDAALNLGGGVVEMTRLDRIMSFDAKAGVITAEAGLSVADIYELLLPRGWFVPVTAGTRFVTLGGAVANDIHGKNHHKVGSFSEFVDELTLLVPSGEVLTCSRDLRPEVFWATVGGLGLTGIILTVTLRLKPVETAYVRVDTRRMGSLAETLEAMAELDPRYDYSVAWIDCLATGASLGRTVLMHGREACLADLPQGLPDPFAAPPKPPLAVPFDLPSWVLNRHSVGAFNALYYAAHPSREYQLVHYDSYFYPLDSIGTWNRLYGASGFLQYQVTFPTEQAEEGLTVVLEALSSAGAASFLAVLKSFGEEGGGMLSYPSPGYFLALDLPLSPSTVRLLRDLEPEVLGRGGRLYAAKDSVMTPEAFRQMYPRLGEFRAVQRELDPDRRLSSSLARRLEILDG
jgi:FAD/FMN-containing dehydrogenase